MVACLRCGEPNPDAARFCNACGAELSTAPNKREARKTVTVLFADVTGSTALGEQLDPESLRRVMARYFEAARQCLERHGGTVEKFIGDAVMAVFGVPTAHEDDALRAVRAAAELRDSLALLNDELMRDYGISLQVRTGVNTGEVVAGTEERLATGDAVNVAARLEQNAPPGEILVGEATRDLAAAALEVEPVEPLDVKGKSAPVRAYRLVNVIEGAPAFGRQLDAPLVGREGELGQLRDVFEQAVSERRCRLVTVLGPPGIGKSRLVRELAATVGGEATVLWGSCLPYGESITYWPLVEIFREAGAAEELATALSADAPEEVFWAVRKSLERRARERPVLLVVDDIQWAEPTLLDLLEHLVDWSRDAPLLLACLARPELLDERPGWGGRRITLDLLSEHECEELIGGLVGGSRLDPAMLARVSEAAEGNPLFVEQMLAMLAEGGDLERVPPTIQALLTARLDALPTEEQTLLERGAVVGLEFEWEALARLASDGRRPSGAQLAALVRKDLIVPHDVIEDSFRFRHALIRDAAYERIPKEHRAELHERAASDLDGRGEEFDELAGYHLEQAHRCVTELAPAGERARVLADAAAERLAASGLRAYARGDVLATTNLLERAVRLLSADDARRLLLLPRLGRALREAGRVERAEEVLIETAERGRATGARAVAADARLALYDLRFHSTAKTGVGREDVLREVDAAILVFAEVGDEAGLARALALGGQLRLWGGEAAAAVRDLERAAAHARDAGDRAQEASSLGGSVTAMLQGPMPVEDALRRIDVVRSRSEFSWRLEVSMLGSRAHLEAMRGRLDTAREVAVKATSLAEEHGLNPHGRPFAGYVELMAGDAAAAERELRIACARTEEAGELGFLSSIVPHLVDALLALGHVDEAVIATERWRPERLTVPEDVDAQAGWRRVRAKVLARIGRIEEAERLARDAVAIASDTDFLSLQAQTHADLGEVLSLADRREDGVTELEEALRLFEQKGVVVAARRLQDRLDAMCPEGRRRPTGSV